MNRAVLISIKPRWCELIADGKKTLEVRRTRPRMLAPFKVYIYETRGDERFGNAAYNSVKIGNGRGKVIGEFICDWCDVYMRNSADISELALQSLVQQSDLYVYMGEKNYLYGWHITDLIMYGTPKELSEFYRWWDGTNDIRPCQNGRNCKHLIYDYSENCQACAIDFDGTDCPFLKVQRPPQSWGYVEKLEE